MAIRYSLLSLSLLFLLFLTGCPSPPGVYHTVKKGQTLYSISHAYGVDEGYLARINHVDDPTLLQTGTRLYIPGAERVLTLRPSVTKVQPSPARAVPKKHTAPPVRKPSAPPSPSTVSGTFDWPVRGDLIRKFSVGGKTLSKGIEISAPRGTPVLSSAAGRVIYSGDGLRGYGNLIILKHDDSFFTVYGYNSKNLVESGSFVSKGQRIALSGLPPSGGPTRLYFEIRHGKDPVDPIFYLP